MIRNKTIWCGGLMAVALTACGDSNEAATEETKVGLDVAMGTFQQTRSTDMDTWDMYDQIGISMCYHTPAAHPESQNASAVYYDPTAQVQPFNRCYYTTTAGSSEFTYNTAQDKIWFPTDTTEVDFVAYYPYRAGSDQLYALNLNGQATNGEPLCHYDLMWGVTRGLDKSHSMVVIPFRHQLTQVVCYIKPVGDLTMSMLRDASVSLSHQKSQATMDVLTSELQYNSGDTELSFISGIARVDGDSCLVAKAIVLPNDEVQNPATFVETSDKQESLDKNRHILLLLPSADGKVLAANLKATTFKPGEKHVFRLEAQMSQLLLISGEIVEWETIEHDETTILD